MGVLGMRDLHAQQAYGYPRADACTYYVENDFAIDTFSAYDTEWDLIVNRAYDHYRVADDPDVCFEVPAGLQNQVLARVLINFVGFYFLVLVLFYVTASLVERVAPKAMLTLFWLAVFVFVVTESLARSAHESVPTLTGFIGGTLVMMTKQQLRDPCSAMVIETDVPFYLYCRDVLPRTDGPENRQRVEPEQR